jgi:hypothetical protein
MNERIEQAYDINLEIGLPATAGLIPGAVAPLSSMKLDPGGVKMAEEKFFAGTGRILSG